MENNFPLPILTNKEDIFDNVLQNIPFGFSLMNQNDEVEFTNEAFLETVQKQRSELLGNNFFKIFPETKKQLKPIFDQVKISGLPFSSTEFKVELGRNNNLEKVFLNFVYHPVRNNEGILKYFAFVVLEITDLVGIKNKIQGEEERLRLATESSQTATWDLNLNTKEIIHSSYLAEIFGYSSDKILSHETLRSHISAEDRLNILDKAFEEALKTGHYKYESVMVDHQGVEKWISTNGKIFFDENGKPNRMLGVLQDVTERKKNEILLKLSHHQLDMAMDATKLGRFDMDFDTQEKYNFSPRFLEIFGYGPSEEVDSHIFERHIHKNFIKVREEALKQARETGNLYYQTKVVLRDESVKWVELYGRMLEPIEGRKAYITGTIRDITAYKTYEKDISDSEKKYRFLADSMPQIVWIGEVDGQLSYFNQETLNYSGKNYNEFIEADGWLDIVHPDDRKENVRLWERSIRTNKPFFCEHRFRNKDNEYRWFLSRAYPEFDEAGMVQKWVGTSTDIDEIKKQEKQKNDFIKMANHELKTPVTTIKGYVQLLKKMRGDSDDQFLVNSLNTIENQVNKLNLLIGDLLDISRMESGKLPLNKKEFSLVKLVTETIEDIKASEDSHQIDFELKHTRDIEVYADKDRITQVLNNLLTNAIKYSPKSDTVKVKLFVDGECAIVSVEDSGIGMEKEELSKIFNRFYRVSGDDEETFPGFGIGLFIVKDIMNRHEGKIWVESTKNEGSKFYFSLHVIKN